MGGKWGGRRKRARTLLLCRGCQKGVDQPGRGQRCRRCGVRVCDHLAPNLMVTWFEGPNRMCRFCISTGVVTGG